MSDFILPNNTPVASLDCETSFHALAEKEKLYAHYLSRACWLGGHIILLQTSIESSLIYILLHKLFSSQPIKEIKDLAINECNFTEDELTAFLVYACGIVVNFGNYLSFGDTKFIPNLEKEKFEKLISATKFGQHFPEVAKSLLSRCLESIYSLKDKDRQLGFPYIGTTTYFSKNFTAEDNNIVTNFLKRKNLEVYNSRVFKTIDESGQTCYEIKLASVLNTDDEEEKDLLCAETTNSHKFLVTRGDYSKILELVIKELQQAKKYAANENQEQMINKYIQSFHTGSLDAHKDGSRLWIKDKSPIIESYIGFIETYKDPAGMRAEFEGFVAIVNKSMSTKFSNLVSAAEEFLPLLPWPTSYEKDKFLQPDFTSLDLLTYSSGDIPLGINIPNYEEIRQSEGFKNVSLGNVINATSIHPPNFMSKEDQELYQKFRVATIELQVGLHELLGHGSGKLFRKENNGNYNFDVNKVLHLDTNEKISRWYEEGETYDSVFGSLGGPYEECRAECVSYYLCTVPDILRIFGHQGHETQTIMYLIWLSGAHSGLEALKMYDPKTESWLEAHRQADYVIFQVLLEIEEPFIKLDKVTGEDGNPDILITLDQDKILNVGKPCLGNFLKKLQLYKSTADVASAKTLFNKYSKVTSEGKYPFLEYREIVIARKKPRRIFVQGNTFIEDGKVKLKNYLASFEGLIESWLDRFRDDSIDCILDELWEKNKNHFI